MIELFPEGFEEREATATVELAAYSDGDGASARGWPARPGADLEVVAGWEDAWRGFHRPVRVGPALGRPALGEPPTRLRIAVVVDPGQAFGTGAHATTRLCLELLLELEPTSLARPRLRVRRARRRGREARLRAGRRARQRRRSPSRRRARTRPRTAWPSTCAAADVLADALPGRDRRREHRPRAGRARSPSASRGRARRRLRLPGGGATRSRRAGLEPTGGSAEGWAADLLVRPA